MNKLILTVVLLLSGATAGAQDLFTPDDTRLFYGGLQAGANFSQIDGDGFSGYRKVGIAGTATVYVRFLHILGASLGIGFAQKGSSEARIAGTAVGPAVFRYRVHLQYAELPLLLHYFPGRRLHYSAGFSYGRLISSTETAEDIYPIQISPELYPFQKVDWSGIAGLTYRFYGSWFIQGQYQYTLGSIRSEPYIPPGFGAGRQRNNTMTIRLLYVIGSGTAR